MSGTGSGTGSGRHAAPESGGGPRRTGVLAAGAVAVVAVVAAAVTGWPVSMPWSGDDSSSGQNQAGSSTAASGSSSASASASPSTGADSADSADSDDSAAAWLRTCAAKVAGQEKVVDAAADGVRDWHGHVQARTDMFAGRISQDEMHRIWTRTKLAGPAEQQRFEAAVQKHPAESPCSKPSGLPAGARAAADECRARSKAAARAVAAAHAAMHDWESHLTNMSSYAHGGMSATMAQDKWVASWRHAPTNITAYDAARDALRDAPACAAQAD